MKSKSTTIKAKITLALVSLILLLTGFLFVGFGPSKASSTSQSPSEIQNTGQKPTQKEQGSDQGSTGKNKKPDTNLLIVHSEINANDLREVYAASDNVFVGNVEAKLPPTVSKSSIPDDAGITISHYKVSVEEVVKSSGDNPIEHQTDPSNPATQSVNVSQIGGENPKTGQKSLVQNVNESGTASIDFLLETGKTYMFATIDDDLYDSRRLAVQPGGAQPITGDTQKIALLDLYEKVHTDVEASPEKFEPTKDHDSQEKEANHNTHNEERK